MYIKCGKHDTKRVTFVVTIKAAGEALKPMVTFKGARNGCIVKCKFPSYTAGFLNACQENVWMDEACMLHWVNDFLKPHVETTPLGVIPVLLLDSHRCHMISSTVEPIPGGCTELCQPVDMGFNKPFKGRMCKVWEEWMMESGLNEETSEVNMPKWQDMAHWVCQAYWCVPSNVISNSWRHAPYDWLN